MSEMVKNKPSVLIQGPSSCDAEFFGKWLLAAAKAEAFWRRAVKDRNFHKRVDRLMVASIPDFEIAATYFLRELWKDGSSFVVCSETAEAEDLVVMAEMGFFIPTCGMMPYKFSIPSNLNAIKVRGALLKLVETEDKQFMLHPEDLIVAMPLGEAMKWRKRLSAIRKLMGEDEEIILF